MLVGVGAAWEGNTPTQKVPPHNRSSHHSSPCIHPDLRSWADTLESEGALDAFRAHVTHRSLFGCSSKGSRGAGVGDVWGRSGNGGSTEACHLSFHLLSLRSCLLFLKMKNKLHFGSESVFPYGKPPLPTEKFPPQPTKFRRNGSQPLTATPVSRTPGAHRSPNGVHCARIERAIHFGQQALRPERRPRVRSSAQPKS